MRIPAKETASANLFLSMFDYKGIKRQAYLNLFFCFVFINGRQITVPASCAGKNRHKNYSNKNYFFHNTPILSACLFNEVDEQV